MSNQKGFTIVELLIGMVILSIVTAALTGFIVSSSKSYAASNTEIVVQQESQLAMNQISDVVIDTTRSVNYVGFSTDGSESEQVLKDADFTIDVGDKCLTLYNGEGKILVDENGKLIDKDGNLIPEGSDPVFEVDGEGNGNKNYQIYWDKDNEKLYFSEADISSLDFPEADRVVLADFVKDFSVDLSQVEEKRVVSITISYEYNNRLYETSNNITIRNRVLVNSVNLEVNRKVELKVRPKEYVVTLEPGEDYYRFSTPIVEGKNIIDKSVTWSISDEEKANLTDSTNTKFTDEANGIIHISSAEKVNSFYVTVTTNAVDSEGKHADADILVYVKRAKDVGLSKTDDSASNGALEISAGCKFTITADVTGTQLGYTCDDCGDEVTIDKDVVAGKGVSSGWWVEDTNGIVEDSWTCDNGQAQFAIKSTAQPGQTIKIWATSLLSVTGNSHHRKYTDLSGADAPVFGYIELTVKKSNSSLHMPDSGFKYGDEPLTLTWDRPSAYALICVRIRNIDKPEEAEKLIIYNTDGYEIRVGADLFGLNLDYNYSIAMQVLDYQLPGGGMLTHSGFHESCTDDLCKDFVNNEYLPNCDSNGEYKGDIPASSVATALLRKPELTVNYNGGQYISQKVDMGVISALQGEVVIPCNITAVSSTRGDGERVLNDVKVDVKFAGEDLYTYDKKGSSGYQGTSEKGPLKFSNCSVSNGLQLQVKIEGNGNAKDAVGSYSFVPFFSYSNKTDAARFRVHYANYTPDYDLHYYTREENTINFTITASGNMTLVAYDAENKKLRRGDIFFPVPSDTNGFAEYFDMDTLKDGNVHYSKKGISTKLYCDNGDKKDINISSMTCQYVVNDGKPQYELKLFYSVYDMFFERYIVTTAGTFVCDVDGSEWAQKYSGPLDADWCDKEIRGAGNAQILVGGSKQGYQGNIYLPLPTDSDFENEFGFKLDTIKEKSYQKVHADTDYGRIKYKGQGGDSATYRNAECYYDKDTKTYTFKFDVTTDQNNFNKDGYHTISTFTFTEGDTVWTKVVD